MILKLKREYFLLLLAVLISLNGLNCQYYKKPIESKNNAQIYRQKTPDKNKKVTLENYFNEIYYANVTIGSPPQNFSLLVSTAVSFIWVPSLVTSGKKKKTFNPRNSKTAVCQSNSWNIKGLLAPHTLYGTDNSSGLITCEDTVRFGEVTLNKQTFGLANVLDPYFGPNQRSDGILGLGFPSTNIFSSDSVLTSIEKQSSLDRNVFSIWLNLNYMNENRGGEITFGGINSDLFVWPLFYVPLSTPNEAWKIEIESVSMGSNLLDRNFQALVDVGNGCINLPKSVFNRISSILNRNLTKSFDIPCHLISTLPPISFTIVTSNYGRRTFTVDPSTYTQETPFYNVCFICIDSFDSDAWVLGDPFISQFYTVFDAENQQLGFAKSVRI